MKNMVMGRQIPAKKRPMVRDEAAAYGDADALLAQAEAILMKRWQGEKVEKPGDMAKLLIARLVNRPNEELHVVFLDNRHRILAIEAMFQGSIDTCAIPPRGIVIAALRYNAAAVILAHNHPSGLPEPSSADRAITQQIKQALALVEVRLLDHFVIGGMQAVSMAERGWV